MPNPKDPPSNQVVLEEQFPSPPPVKGSGPRRASQQRNRERSVIFYIAILFAAAVLLLLLTLLMEQRQTGESLNDLNQSIAASQNSGGSATQKLEQLYQSNADLQAQVEDLEAQLSALQKQYSQLEAQASQGATQEQFQRLSDAMDWFWQINEAYVRGRYTTCRELIQSLKDANLEDALPKVSITDNKRFSPYDRYQEIYNALY